MLTGRSASTSASDHSLFLPRPPYRPRPIGAKAVQPSLPSLKSSNRSSKWQRRLFLRAPLGDAVGHPGHLQPSPSWRLPSSNERLRALKSFLFFGEKREHGACLAGSQAPESFGSASPATSCFREFNVARERKMCSPLVSRKGNQEHGTKGARIVLLIQAAGQPGMVENPAELHLQQGPSLDRAVIQELLKGRKIGAYQDLAQGGEQFLSRSRVHTPPGKGKQRIVHALCSLNEATVKRQTTYEDLRMLTSVVRPQDFMLSLDVESAYFHVPIHPSHRKFFASHLALPLFVKNKFIELQPGGYFVCTRPDLAQVPSAQTPPHLRHHYHQVVEFSHAALPLGWTSSPRIWTSVMSVVAAALRRHGMRTLLYVDDLLIACSSFEEASRARLIIEETLLAAGIVRAPLKGCFDTPTQTLPDHLGFIISSLGKGALQVPERRCFALRRQARALLFEAAKNRRLVDSNLLRRFSGAAISCLPAVPLARFHLREVFNAQEQYKPKSFLPQAAVDSLLFWRNFSLKSPENLQELWPDQASTALYTDASGTTGWGSVLEPPHEATRSSAGWWASQELLEMIALKELKACRYGLLQNVEALRHRTVKLYQDNMAVVGALRKMSSKCPEIMAVIKELVPWLHVNKIRLEVVYIRSEANLADAPSRQRGFDMWSFHALRSKSSWTKSRPP